MFRFKGFIFYVIAKNKTKYYEIVQIVVVIGISPRGFPL